MALDYSMNRQTYHAKNHEVTRQWRQIDATDQILGRLATRIAVILMGKDKPQYTPHHDVGDFVVVVNAGKLRLTGNKLDQKFHQTFSGHPSGRKTYSYRHMLEEKPEKLLQLAVRRMLPKNRLATVMLSKLKVYRDAEHPHSAQQPQVLALESA
jgi:large subunit ribosomal protein L13